MKPITGGEGDVSLLNGFEIGANEHSIANTQKRQQKQEVTISSNGGNSLSLQKLKIVCDFKNVCLLAD